MTLSGRTKDEADGSQRRADDVYSRDAPRKGMSDLLAQRIRFNAGYCSVVRQL